MVLSILPIEGNVPDPLFTIYLTNLHVALRLILSLHIEREQVAGPTRKSRYLSRAAGQAASDRCRDYLDSPGPLQHNPHAVIAGGGVCRRTCCLCVLLGGFGRLRLRLGKQAGWTEEL
jgi:hypothetical protein